MQNMGKKTYEYKFFCLTLYSINHNLPSIFFNFSYKIIKILKLKERERESKHNGMDKTRISFEGSKDILNSLCMRKIMLLYLIYYLISNLYISPLREKKLYSI